MLAGFMGVGKSTIAKELASRLGCTFVDLDDWITAHTGQSPAAHIRRDGEPSFRQLELNSLKTVISNPPLIIALGGGTIHITGCKALLENTCVIILECRLDVVLERIKNSNRPLANQAELLYQKRSRDYLQFPNRIDVTELQIDSVIEQTLMLWAQNEPS
ncbi:MAG: shikimate kinase [Myxococcota bacterium]